MLVTTGTRTTGTMRLDEIVTEICKRVNDPFEDNYAERARELFVASVYQGYKDPKYTKFDIMGLLGLVISVQAIKIKKAIESLVMIMK